MFNILAYIDKGTHSIFYVSLAIPDVSKVHYGGGGILFPLRMPLMILKRLLSFSESPPTIMPWLEDYGLKKKKKKSLKAPMPESQFASCLEYKTKNIFVLYVGETICISWSSYTLTWLPKESVTSQLWNKHTCCVQIIPLFSKSCGALVVHLCQPAPAWDVLTHIS